MFFQVLIWKKNEFLDNNREMVYFSGIKNLIKPI